MIDIFIHATQLPYEVGPNPHCLGKKSSNIQNDDQIH
jgi:hypothetical protein